MAAATSAAAATRWLLLAGLLLAGAGCSSSAQPAPGTGGGAGGSDHSGGAPGSAGGRTGGGAGNGAASGTGGSAVTTGAGGATGAGGFRQQGVGGGAPDAAPDASRVDATTPADAGADARPSAACAGLFCEDFERGVIDPAIWDTKVNGGQATPNLVTQAGLVAHGKYAAHFRANPNVVSYDFIITRAPPVALAGHHFGRAYFMITPMPPTNHTEYVYAGTTGFPKYRYLEVASAAPLAWQLTYVDLASTVTGEDYHAGGKVPVGKWICLEWEFNDQPDTAAVFVDGVQDFTQNSFTFNGSTTGLVGGFAAFGFGYYAWHPATYAFDVYYDDIVLDTRRVGCLP
jgi:hypothetical protein